MDNSKQLEMEFRLKDGTFSQEEFSLLAFGLGRHGATPEQITYRVTQKEGTFYLHAECEVTAEQEEEAVRARYERHAELSGQSVEQVKASIEGASHD